MVNIEYIVMFIYRLAAGVGRSNGLGLGLGKIRYGIISNLFKKKNQA